MEKLTIGERMPNLVKRMSMLMVIVQHSAELVVFITALNPALYRPQIRHLLQLADTLLTCNETKAISGLYQLLLESD
jgi:hypothetical protein